MDTETIFRNLVVDIAKKEKYEDYSIDIKPITSGGANFTTTLYTAVVSAPNKEDLQLFGKVANVSEKMRAEVFSSAVYEVERIAYTELIEIYRKLEEKHGIPEEDRLPVPKVYAFNTEYGQESVVLDNLGAKGFSLHDRLKPVDWLYASKAIEIAAKFHALSMVYAEEDPDRFHRHGHKLTSLLKHLYDGFSKAKDMILPITLPVLKEENRDRLKVFVDKNEITNLYKLYKSDRRPMIVHADFKPSNLMHRYNEDGTIDMFLVDLQTIQPSCGVLDIFNFIFSATDADFRKEYYEKLLDHYYETLSRMLRAYHLNPDKIYSREEFDNDLKERQHVGLLFAVFTLPITTVEEHHAPDPSAEVSMEDFDFKVGSVFPERMNGIVDDFVRWGVI